MKWMLIAPLPAGCVIQATDPFGLFGGDGSTDIEDIVLEADPSSIAAGETSIVEIFDANGAADFTQVFDVRALGAYTILEYTQAPSGVMLVVDVLPEATGEQPLAVDFGQGTVYGAFRAF